MLTIGGKTQITRATITLTIKSFSGFGRRSLHSIARCEQGFFSLSQELPVFLWTASANCGVQTGRSCSLLSGGARLISCREHIRVSTDWTCPLTTRSKTWNRSFCSQLKIHMVLKGLINYVYLLSFTKYFLLLSGHLW